MQTLSEAAAQRFLARNTLGRLGCYSPTLERVYVVPVSYRLRGRNAYFGCVPGQKLDYLRAHPMGVCLQVDQIIDEQDWMSVIATGHVEELSGYQFLIEQGPAIARAGKGPLRWTFLEEGGTLGHRLVLCALRIEEITGRRDVWWAAPELMPAMSLN